MPKYCKGRFPRLLRVIFVFVCSGTGEKEEQESKEGEEAAWDVIVRSGLFSLEGMIVRVVGVQGTFGDRAVPENGRCRE